MAWEVKPILGDDGKEVGYQVVWDAENDAGEWVVAAAFRNTPESASNLGWLLMRARDEASRIQDVPPTEFRPDFVPIRRRPSSLIPGVGPDAPIITNDDGGRHSAIPFRFDLLPPIGVLEVARIMHAGNESHGKDRWRAVPLAEQINHALMHLYAYLAGDRTEDHLGHAACRTLMAKELATGASE